MGRFWTYLRDDRSFAGLSPPAALYYASRDRRQEHPERHLKTFTGILQADAYGGYNPLFKLDRNPNPLRQAFVGHIYGCPRLCKGKLAALVIPAAAVIYSASKCAAPCDPGLDGKSANQLPITRHELEVRRAQRALLIPGLARLCHYLLFILATTSTTRSNSKLTWLSLSRRHRDAHKPPPPNSSSAQTIRTVLFATATTATLAGRRSLSLMI